MSKREVVEGIQTQGVDEQIAYAITTTPWGGSPSGVAFVVKDESDSYRDVTATVAPGAASVVGDVITLPKIKLLTQDHTYRVEVKFNDLECYFRIQAEL